MLKFLTHKLRTHSLNEDPNQETDDDHDSGTESDDEFQDGAGNTDEPSSRKCRSVYLSDFLFRFFFIVGL